MSLKIFASWTALIIWLNSGLWAGGQTITTQPVSDEGDEGDSDSLVSLVFQVSGMDVITQIVAIRRGIDVIADETLKRESVFEKLGLDSDKYVITRQVILPEDDKRFALRLSNPARIDSAGFTFVVCGRNMSDSTCVESDIVLESNTASFIVRYLPGGAYPNCSAVPKLYGIAGGGGQRVFLGESTNMSCQSEIGRPPVKLAWEKDSQEVNSETTGDGEFRYSTHTFTPSLDDEGVVFSCNLTRPPSNDLNRSCIVGALDVVSVPSVEVTYEDVNGHVLIGSTVIFTASATTVTSSINIAFWIIPDGLQNATNRYTIDDIRFTLINVQRVDNGAGITYAAIDNDGIQGIGLVILKVIDAADLPTQSPGVVTATKNTATWTTKPPSKDYSATIIGSLFALLLLVVLVVMVFIWYWREVRPRKKKSTLALPRIERSTQKPNSPLSHQKELPLDKKGGRLIHEDSQNRVEHNDPDMVHRKSQSGAEETHKTQGMNHSSRRYEDNFQIIEAYIPHQEHHPSPSYEKYRYRSNDNDYPKDHYDDMGSIGSKNSGKYPDYCIHSDDDNFFIETTENRYQNINHRYDTVTVTPSDLYPHENDAYDGSYDEETGHDGRYYPDNEENYRRGGVPNNDDEHSFGRLSPSELSEERDYTASYGHRSPTDVQYDWSYVLEDADYEGAPSYV